MSPQSPSQDPLEQALKENAERIRRQELARQAPLVCKALQDEYELLQRRLDQLVRERVQAQLRERERE